MANHWEEEQLLASSDENSDTEFISPRAQAGAREVFGQGFPKWTAGVLGVVSGLVAAVILWHPGDAMARGVAIERRQEVTRFSERGEDWDDELDDVWGDDDGWGDSDGETTAGTTAGATAGAIATTAAATTTAGATARARTTAGPSPTKRNHSQSADVATGGGHAQAGSSPAPEHKPHLRPPAKKSSSRSPKKGAATEASPGAVFVDEADDDDDDFEEEEVVVLKTDSSCADSGRDCSSSRCCSRPGEQCYKKNSSYAVCRAGCLAGRHVTEEGGQPWSCEMIGDRTPGKPQKCSAIGENCINSHCCRDIGMQCYQKNSKFALCKHTCSKAMDPTDKDDKPWTCKELGTRRTGRAQWVLRECAEDWGDCTKSKCCQRAGLTCFARDSFWASCREACEDQDWSCKKLGPKMPVTEEVSLAKLLPKFKAAPWVSQKCSSFGANCSGTLCCKDPGATCYRKDNEWASCKAACVKGPDASDKDGKRWSCEELGPQTPGAPAKHVLEGGKKSSWVDEECADTSADCSESRCCKEEGFQCLKDGARTTCRNGCSGCEALGSRTVKAWDKVATIFCFSVVMRDTYEVDVLREQLRRRAGIYACEDYAVFSQGEGFTLDDELGGEVVGFESAGVGVSRDGTAGNAKLFMNVWDAVKPLEKWKVHDWTIKTDPDAVMLPDRLRIALAKVKDDTHMGDSLFAYIKTCRKEDGMKSMMFGALEALTKVAVQKYFEGFVRCKELEWQTWGEDLFMMKCLDNLGAIGMDQHEMVDDELCKGVDCSNSRAAVFHPMKNLSSWTQCFQTAIR